MPQWPEGFAEHLADGEASASDSEAAGSWESRAITESGIREAQRILRIAKSAEGPKLQGHFAEIAPAFTYLAWKMLVT